MKINIGKSYTLFSGNDNVSANLTIIPSYLKNELRGTKNELLGIILDSKLSFEDHINNLKKTSQKLNTL